MHKLITISRSGKPTDITPVIGETAWYTNVNDVSSRLDLTAPYADGQYIPKAPVEIGGVVILQGSDAELFRGFITGSIQNGSESISYTARDHGFYLAQSDGIYKFAGSRADDCIKRICTDFGIKVGTILSMSTAIKQKYIGDKLSDIIKDILDKHKKETGVKAMVVFRKGLLYVEKPSETPRGGLVCLSEGTAWVDWAGTIGKSISRNRSMDDMRTIVKVVVDEAIKGQARNEALIALYGKLQEVIRVDSKDGGQAAVLAKEALKEKGRLSDAITLSALGVDSFSAGGLISLAEPYTGASGQYRINAAEHTYSSAMHTMKLELEAKI